MTSDTALEWGGHDRVGARPRHHELGIARWDEATGQPQLVELPDVCRNPGRDDPLEAPRMVPSAVHLLEAPGLLDRLGSWPPVASRLFLGRRALIGRLALERNREAAHPAFVPTFKAALSSESTRPLAGSAGTRSPRARWPAPFCARCWSRPSTRPASASATWSSRRRSRPSRPTGPRCRASCSGLGVRRVRFVDEPVAAALGYGLSLSHERTVLVVDIGGGTMHVVLVALSPRGAMGGEARVLAKQGRPLGGNAVDGWVLEEACRQAGYPPLDAEGDDNARFWRRLMLAEACRVKEAVHFDETAVFRVTPPGFGRLSTGAPAGSSLQTFTRAQLGELLETNGFYRGLDACLAAMFEDGRARVEDVDDVLLVGGSTLLPGVFARLEQRFERRRMRAWQPFEAVAYGGACFAADRIGTLDFIVHDYAFVTHDAKTGEAQHTVIVPRGTRFPTPPDFWKRQLVPTCSLGEPESIFRLVICEVARGEGTERRFVFDASGDLHKVGGTTGEDQVVVPLNAASPTLGYLEPPHDPKDRRPRLEIAFGVNAERWLVATVVDLLTRKELMSEEPVVRLI